MSLPLLRRSLVAPISNGSSAFILPCKKLIFEYCETWGSNRGMKDFLLRDVVAVAEKNQGVEVVVRRVENRHPHVRGIYGASVCVGDGEGS